jgi:hypothetical protein
VPRIDSPVGPSRSSWTSIFALPINDTAVNVGVPYTLEEPLLCLVLFLKQQDCTTLGLR